MTQKKATRSGDAPTGGLDGDQVAAWLRENPDFLRDRPDLLAVLLPPQRRFESEDGGGEIVDLQDAMLDRMRTELKRREDQCNELIDAGRENLQTQSRVHAAVLALLGARSLDHLVELLTIDLAGLLHVDAVALCLEGSRVAPATNQGVRVVPRGTIEGVLGITQPVTLRADVPGDRRLFGEGAGLVRSDALLRLTVRSGAPVALLALGSRDPQRFHAGQRTEMLTFLSRIMEHCIRAWLDLPQSQTPQ